MSTSFSSSPASLIADCRAMAQALKEIINAIDAGTPYTLEELLGPDFDVMQSAMARHDVDNDEYVRLDSEG